MVVDAAVVADIAQLLLLPSFLSEWPRLSSHALHPSEHWRREIDSSMGSHELLCAIHASSGCAHTQPARSTVGSEPAPQGIQPEEPEPPMGLYEPGAQGAQACARSDQSCPETYIQYRQSRKKDNSASHHAE